LGRTYEKSDEELAHDLINPLLYFDKVAAVVQQGFVRARTGQEMSVEAAIAMFENYLGIAQRRADITADVKALNVELAERRAARRKQLFAEALVSFTRYSAICEKRREQRLPRRLWTKCCRERPHGWRSDAMFPAERGDQTSTDLSPTYHTQKCKSA
jgi:hypothetical protein